MQMWKNCKILNTEVKEQILAGQASGRATPIQWICSSATEQEATSNGSQGHSSVLGARHSHLPMRAAALRGLLLTSILVFLLSLLLSMKFNKEICKALHLGQNGSQHQCRLGSVWAGNCSAEMAKESWNQKLSKSQKCTLANYTWASVCSILVSWGMCLFSTIQHARVIP